MNEQEYEKVFIWEAVYDLEIWQNYKTDRGAGTQCVNKSTGLKIMVVTTSDSVGEVRKSLESKHGQGKVTPNGDMSVWVKLNECRFLSSAELYKPKA